jgi:Domain of unknown function (DUF4160)
MPTVLLINGFRFFFYSNENDEPIHIHVRKGNAEGKIWLEPSISLSYFRGFSTREENDIIEIAAENFDYFKTKWNEYFKK